MNMNNKIDVIMCTWNSNKPWFKRCLISIKREIPVCHFIVVDRFSNDGTVSVIKNIFPDAVIVQNNFNLGKARQEGIKYVDTQWFAFIDDDIELFNGWFKTITNYIRSSTGAIAFVALPELEWLKKLSCSSREITQSLRKPWIILRRIYCTNTLIRTSIVKDWDPPSFLSSGEDIHLSKHIIDKGYEIILLYNYYVKHHGRWGLNSSRKNLWHYAGLRILKMLGYINITTTKLVKRFFFSFLKGIYISIKLKEPLALCYLILSDLYRLKGWIEWNKYLVWRR